MMLDHRTVKEVDDDDDDDDDGDEVDDDVLRGCRGPGH